MSDDDYSQSGSDWAEETQQPRRGWSFAWWAAAVVAASAVILPLAYLAIILWSETR